MCREMVKPMFIKALRPEDIRRAPVRKFYLRYISGLSDEKLQIDRAALNEAALYVADRSGVIDEVTRAIEREMLRRHIPWQLARIDAW
jgi:hypothetical protein